MKKKSKNIYIYITALICVLSIIPFIYVAFYSRPSADDFDYSYTIYHLINGGKASLLKIIICSFTVMKNFYYNWQGTYSSAILMSLQPGIFGDKYYCLGTFFLMLLMYLCLYKFFKTINKRILNFFIPTWFISLLFFTVLIQTVPYLNQCFYWFCGAAHYIPFFFLTLVVVSYIIEYLCESNKNKRIKYIVVSSLISFIISGGNQVTSFLNILILFISIAYSLYRKKKSGLIITLLVAIIGFVIMFIAPGNNVRIEATTQTNVFVAIINSFKGGFKYAARWVNFGWFSFIVLLNTLLLSFINTFNKKIDFHPLIIIVITFLLYFAMFCPTNYAMSSNGPGRLKNVIYFASIFFSILDSSYLLIWLKQKKNIRLVINEKIKHIIIIFCTICMCFTSVSNCLSIAKELKDGTAKEFASAYDNRIIKMNDSNDEIVYVDALPDSLVLKFDDITADINDWRNGSWSKYYRVNTALKPQ